MSLIKDFSPKRTRQGGGSQASKKLAEVRTGPVQEIVQEVEPEQELIDKYAYDPEKEKKSAKVAEDSFRAIAQEEQSPQEAINCPEFGLFNMLAMCEEHLLQSLYGVQDPKIKKIYDLQRYFIEQKLEIVADSKKEIKLGAFREQLYYYKGEVIIPQEYIVLTGFLREYFDIEKVIVAYDTGEILLQDTGYCGFWNKKRLQKFFSGSLRELSHTEVQKDENCLKCIFNYNCPFSRAQQMAK